MQHRADDVEAVEQTGLLGRNGDEGRLRVSGPELDFRVAGRVVQRLKDRRRREPRKRQRHRVVLGLVVNDVEIARPLDGRGKIQQLVQLPRPHVLVVAIAVRIDRVQPCRRHRVGRRKQRHVMAARDEAFGQQRRHRLHRSRSRRRNRRGDRRDVRDPQRLRAVLMRTRSRAAAGRTTRASKCSRAMSAAHAACRG